MEHTFLTQKSKKKKKNINHFLKGIQWWDVVGWCTLFRLRLGLVVLNFNAQLKWIFPFTCIRICLDVHEKFNYLLFSDELQSYFG